MKIYTLVEEDIVGARVMAASESKDRLIEKVKQDYAQELRFLADNLWRCGSTIISIQETELE